jgi:26S proteasome regulatory subunit T2
LIYTPLAHLLL